MVTLEMETLVTYSGRGRCLQLSLNYDDDDDLYYTKMKIEIPASDFEKIE